MLHEVCMLRGALEHTDPFYDRSQIWQRGYRGGAHETPCAAWEAAKHTENGLRLVPYRHGHWWQQLQLNVLVMVCSPPLRCIPWNTFIERDMQSTVLGILPLGPLLLFFIFAWQWLCFLTEFKTIRKRCSPSLSSPKHGWRTRMCSASSPFSAAALKAHWQNHCPISFWPLAALGLLSMLYKHYIFFFTVLTQSPFALESPSTIVGTRLKSLQKVLETAATLAPKQPARLTNAVFPVGDIGVEGLQGTEELDPFSGIQHQRCDDSSSLTRQNPAYLAAPSSRSPALLSCASLKLPYSKNNNSD